MSVLSTLLQAEESLAEARKLYDDMNTELHRELPKFYDYRIDFLASNLGRLFSAETTFHCETGKVGKLSPLSCWSFSVVVQCFIPRQPVHETVGPR